MGRAAEKRGFPCTVICFKKYLLIERAAQGNPACTVKYLKFIMLPPKITLLGRQTQFVALPPLRLII